jgi:predicted amidophosphoribosyltransferase
MDLLHAVLRLIRNPPPPNLPAPVCIGCRAAAKKIESGYHLATYCRVCGQQFSRNING